MASNELRAFFKTLSSDAAIQELRGKRETVHLEFKQKANADTPDLDKSDTRLFSRALSGFANSDGGVLIWGIEDQGGIAIGFKPIVHVDEFARRLGSSVLNSTAPVVEGVEIVAISHKGKSGFVKCLIPASDIAPHRAQLDGRDYFKRSATSFYPLEHFDLEDMFGRRLKPSMRVHLALVPFHQGGPDSRRRQVQFHISKSRSKKLLSRRNRM